jgi:hypothetical protein
VPKSRLAAGVRRGEKPATRTLRERVRKMRVFFCGRTLSAMAISAFQFG